MVRELIGYCIRNLNQLPAEKGMSNLMSPLSIVTGRSPIDYNDLTLSFGEYVHVHDDPDPTNTMSPRSIGAIVLSMTPNKNGSYYFLNLNTGTRIRRKKFKKLPITQAVIDRVHSLAIGEGQPEITDDGPMFEWRPRRPFDGIGPTDEGEYDHEGPDVFEIDDENT